MNTPIWLQKLLGLATLAASLIASTACAQTSTAAGSRRIEWLERPWGLQYVLYVTDSWSIKTEVAQERAAERGPGELDRLWAEIIDRSSFHQSRDKWAKPGDGLSVVVIEFDRDGKVTSPHNFPAPLFGRLSPTLSMSLSPGDRATQPRFLLGFWFMGLGDVSTHWAPGLCDARAMPSPFSKSDSGYLYGPVFDPAPKTNATFACREWAYQLGDPNRPYIDITSYYSKKADPDGPGTYVFGTMGWAGFNDERKPVIGKHEADWFCLHDCPKGAQPGLIPDIKAWAAENGWPVPKRPTRIPVFPDPPAKSGHYPQ
jgi:hypothetical protein